MTHPMKLEDFYSKVIEDFGTKLINKYSQKEQGFDSQSIDLIKSKIRQKLQKPQKLFQKALQIKHGSTNQLVIERNTSSKNQVKREEGEENVIHEEIDYANVFDPADGQVKKEQFDGIGVIKHQPNEELEDEKQQEDEKQKVQKVLSVKNSLNVHIVGTYEPRSKKHIAKDESTKLQLENVFIKTTLKAEQIYFTKINCQLTKD